MSNIKNALIIYWEIIVSPDRAFNRIRDERPLFAGVVLLLLQLVLSLTIFYLLSDILEHSFTGIEVIMSVLEFSVTILITVFLLTT